jgi:sugar lactone lactonase YvrE
VTPQEKKMFQHSVKRRLAPPTSRGVVAALLSTVMAAGLGVGAFTVARAAAPTGQTGMIQTVAGNLMNYTQFGYAGDGGQATAAQLYNPRAIAFGHNGDVFIADALNERIRKIDAGGVITTFAGSGPSDSNGSLQNGATPTGTNGDGGPATAAVFNQPHGVAVDSQGNVYIADSNNQRIRKVDVGTAKISTIAGTGDPHTPPGLNGGPASAAGLKFPKSMFMAANDRLYFADSGNNMVRVIDLTANPPTIKTVAGNTQSKHYGGDGGPAVNAQLNTPTGLSVLADGTIYISDSDNNLIRRVDPAGKISTIAGDAAAAAAAANSPALPPTDSAGDGGAATSAHLNGPRGIAADPLGNLYIAEEAGARIRRIDPSGIITTIAGDGTTSGRGQVAGDPGPAPAGQAQFNTIHDLNLDGNGNLWIADSKNNLVRALFDPAHAPAVGTSSPPPSTSSTTAPPPPAPATHSPTSVGSQTGYWTLGSDGKIYAFGDAKSMGDASAVLPAGAKAVHLETTRTAKGYWIVDNDGDVYPYGDAIAAGRVDPADLSPREKVTSLSATPSGKGYWIFTSRGRVFPFGDAVSFGDLSKINLNGPVQSSVSTPTGQGYYMVASDGGVFAFGDAKFIGSMGAVKLNQPVESLVPTRDGLGYWLVASDGGVFAFGNAPFRGSMGSTKLNKPVVGMVRYGNGYLMVAADGGVFDFSDRPFSGSLGDNPPDRPIVFAATLDS